MDDRRFDFFERLSTRVTIRVNRFATLTTKKLVYRHSGAFAEDVPQGHIDATHDVVQHRAIAPVGADKRRLPDVFDVSGVFSHDSPDGTSFGERVGWFYTDSGYVGENIA